jgi:glycosyltransferase involved in cell wall biosynthesis
LSRSLTVLLPVHDVQSTLTQTVTDVLDAAADLTDRFEVLIIDDGSADATSEVAHELARHYPQIRTVRHGRRLGREAAVRTGLSQTRGDVMLVREGQRVTLERVSTPSRPARPNFLGRTKTTAARP